jgi:hypothetical protein
MSNLKLVVSNPYPKRKLTSDTLDAITNIVRLRTELFQQTELLEQTLQQTIEDDWLFELIDFDYPNHKEPITLEQGQRLVAKLSREIGLENE